MSFRERLEKIAETVQELEIASGARFVEGVLLLDDEATQTAGVYLLGYAAEMLLKVASFRFNGARSTDSISDLLAAAKKRAQILNVTADKENYHSLRFWAELLLAERNFRQRKLPKSTEDEFRLRVENLYQNWWIEMRYRTSTANLNETLEVKRSVEWLQNHSQSLWR